MPNWCNNSIEISHSDPAKLSALASAIREGKFLNHIIPVPEDLNIVAGRVGSEDDPAQIDLEAKEKSNLEKYGYSNWYDYCVAKWGTKWDVEAYDPEDVAVKDNKIEFGFDSAWSPPVGVYEAMVEQGYSVRAYYYEPGMAFAGRWEDGDDDYVEYGGIKAKDLREYLGEELDDMFGISESALEWEEEENEED